MSGSGLPPSADSRIACTPQVGASSQEIGRTQSGRTPIGTRKPADQPDRQLQRAAERPRAAVAHDGDAEQEADAPIDTTVTGTDDERTAAGASIVHVDAEQEAAPQQRRDHAEQSPMVAIATVIGSRTSGSGTGAATSSSSVPCRRSRCTTLLPTC